MFNVLFNINFQFKYIYTNCFLMKMKNKESPHNKTWAVSLQAGWGSGFYCLFSEVRQEGGKKMESFRVEWDCSGSVRWERRRRGGVGQRGGGGKNCSLDIPSLGNTAESEGETRGRFVMVSLTVWGWRTFTERQKLQMKGLTDGWFEVRGVSCCRECGEEAEPGKELRTM